MAQFPPDLFDRFARDGDCRRELISKFSVMEGSIAQEICELAKRDLDWVELWSNPDTGDQYEPWVVDWIDNKQKIAAINWQVSIMRQIENTLGMDHAISTEILISLFAISYPDFGRTWRKTQLNAYYRGWEIFEAVYDVWVLEWGVKDGVSGVGERVKIVPPEHRAKRLNDAWSKPAPLHDICRYIGAKMNVSFKSIEGNFYRFVKVAPLLAFVDLDRGRVIYPGVLGKWCNFQIANNGTGAKL